MPTDTPARPGHEVWWCRVDGMWETHGCSLPSGERERVNRFCRSADRDRSTAGALVLRALCSDQLGVPADEVRLSRACRCGASDHGKPVLTDGGGHVSVSHAGEWALVAWSRDAAVGVDVEPASAPVSGLARYVVAPAEQGIDDLLQLWTVKEAYLKATGDGLARAMTTLTTTVTSTVWTSSGDAVPDRGSIVGTGTVSPTGLGGSWCRLVAPPGYRASLAVVGGTPPSARQRDVTARVRHGGIATPAGGCAW